MKIVILDGFAANPGDLSWEGLERFGEVICYPRTAPEKLLERAADADVLLTNKTVLDRQTMENLPQLKMIGVLILPQLRSGELWCATFRHTVPIRWRS